MLGSARRLAAFHAAVIVSMLLPAAALAARPASPGGGKKKPQALWSTAYTYTDCYEADLARAPAPGSVTGWQPSAPDAGAVVAPDENDGDSPHAGSTVRTGIRINTGPIFQALPPVLPGYVARSTSECTGTATSNRDNGALAAGSTWKATSVAPTWQGASTTGAGVWKLIQVRDSVSSLKVTSVFTTAAGGLDAASTGAGYADVVGTLIVNALNCDSPCPFQSDYIVLARKNAQGFAAVTPGDQTVVLTLRAPAGEKLPQGYYQITQLLSTWSSNLRLADQSSSASAAVTAKGFTVTTTP